MSNSLFIEYLGHEVAWEANPIYEAINLIFCRTLFCRKIGNQGPLLLQLPELLARSAQGVGGASDEESCEFTLLPSKFTHVPIRN